MNSRRGFLATTLFASLYIAGCAHTTRAIGQNSSKNSFWSGRLSLQLEQTPPQSFVAGFELSGNAVTGELSFFTPIGSTLALLAWSPGNATLKARGGMWEFESVDELVRSATGTDIPVSALFDWLAGIATTAPGWQADLSQVAAGRLNARRLSPEPAADLRVVLDR
ncbi:MAG: lipoprotein insertase outer membrane protein LolB [Burkholderiales bacterium]|nr:lipoprotein insertase outer membrane protein LolB [Burkholderiales bacterium]